MRRWRGLSFLLVGLWLLGGLVANAGAEPKSGAIKAAKAPEQEITVTGKLIRVMAIGAETTGWAVDLDEPRQIEGKQVTRLEIDPAGQPVTELENRRVEVAGSLVKRSGVERGDRWVIVVKKIRSYTN